MKRSRTTDPAVEAAPSIGSSTRSVIMPIALIRAMRPRQWIKNLLVYSAPLAAGSLTETPVLIDTTLAAFAFCFASSGTYLINDVLDREADRLHPTKRLRPVAASHLSVPVAIAAAAILLAVGVAVGTLVRTDLTIVLIVYVASTLSYSLALKNVPVVELMIVASGFLLRAIAGGAATGIPLSDWFLIVASFGSLFVVAGKRRVELGDLGVQAGVHRAVLNSYPAAFIRMVETVTAAVAVSAYVLWAFEKAHQNPAGLWFKISIGPFVLGVLYYALLVETGAARTPEDTILKERTLQLIAAALFALVAAGIYGR